MTRRIGGQLDASGLAVLSGRDGDYVRRAQQHRPDADGIRRAARDLLALGYSVDDVATSLRVAREQVIAWQREPAP